MSTTLETAYWCVKTRLAEGGEVYVNAETVEITHSGDLLFRTRCVLTGQPNPVLAFSSGNWQAFFAASAPSGEPIAVEKWGREPAATL